jgi:hypothetical protein
VFSQNLTAVPECSNTRPTPVLVEPYKIRRRPTVLASPRLGRTPCGGSGLASLTARSTASAQGRLPIHRAESLRSRSPGPPDDTADHRASDGEQFDDLACRILAGLVQLHQVILLRGRELGLGAAELAGGLGIGLPSRVRAWGR